MEKVEVKVLRYDPNRDETPHYQVYRVPLEEPTSILILLKYIHEEMDPTLAYIGEHICYKGICDVCLATVNGRTERTCMKLVKPGEKVVVEPSRGFPVVRDLVVDRGRQIVTEEGVFIIRKGALVEVKERRS